MANTARNKPGTEKVVAAEESKALERIQTAYETNKKRINTVITVVGVLIVGFFVYQKFYLAPRENKAATAIAYAQRYFERDSVEKALNGDQQHKGFLKIMKTYSGTKTANMCNYYAGICYLQMGDFKNAVKYLEDFDAKGTTLQYVAYGALGDAYMEMKNTKKGIDNYNKATENKEDKVFTPIYLQRIGIAYEMNNQPEDAKKIYKRLRDDYPQSQQARDVEKYLARLGEIE
jgi:tetratricopeptide (TPR) repeat protein